MHLCILILFKVNVEGFGSYWFMLELIQPILLSPDYITTCSPTVVQQAAYLYEYNLCMFMQTHMSAKLYTLYTILYILSMLNCVAQFVISWHVTFVKDILSDCCVENNAQRPNIVWESVTVQDISLMM